MDSILRLMDAGGPIMWLIAADCALLWVLLIHRIAVIYSEQVDQDALRLLQSQPAGAQLHGADLIGLTRNAERTHNLGIIRCLLAIAPLLGLFGTVTGIIFTFEGILLGRQMAAATTGIAEALLTTQFGLAVAVPGILVERVLTRRCEKLALLHDQESAQLRRQEAA